MYKMHEDKDGPESDLEVEYTKPRRCFGRDQILECADVKDWLMKLNSRIQFKLELASFETLYIGLLLI